MVGTLVWRTGARSFSQGDRHVVSDGFKFLRDSIVELKEPSGVQPDDLSQSEIVNSQPRSIDRAAK